MTDKPADSGPAEPARDEATPPPQQPSPLHHEADHEPTGADEAVTAHVDEPTDDLYPSPASDTPHPPPDESPGESPDEQAGGPLPPPPPPGGFPPPPPPGGGFPPPSGSFFPPPQPTGGAFATKYGLIRPQQGRWFAGVCAGIGRATNTDPVLWRVLLGVLSLFGGVGLLVYLVGWLLIPSEGDSASPAEALIGRGRSSTSAPVALALGVLAVIMFAVAFSGNVRSALLGAAVILGAALLVSRGGGNIGRPANTPPPSPPTSPPPQQFTPPAPGAPTVGVPFAAATPPPAATGPYPPGQNPPPPMEHPVMEPGTAQTPTGYRPPFAPHGPYASSSPYAQSLGYTSAPTFEYPGLAQQPPAPVSPPRERSRLGRLVISLVCLVIGTLAVVDVAGASIPGTAYLAATLGVIGFGLVIGAWLGRARWLIFPGLVVLAGLTIGSSAAHWDVNRPDIRGPKGNVTWAPTSVSELQSNYAVDFGNGTLDLSKVDFRDHSVPLDIHVDVGNLVVILPPDVDVNVSAKVDGGSADVLGQHWDGFGNDTRQVRDNGTDGPGGGQLRLNASVDLGKLEVHR